MENHFQMDLEQSTKKQNRSQSAAEENEQG